MIPLGKTKRGKKLHPHNECLVCSEGKILKRSERFAAKREIEKQKEDYCVPANPPDPEQGKA